MTQRTRCMMLSLLVPGWGQFEQGRAKVGRRFLGPFIALVLLWPTFVIAGWPVALVLVDLAALTLWSAADAWRGTTASTSNA
ncbi:MAG: hypothetical protein IPK85_04680 [Gemmatimonadetes bacterium]|nr:hypothetical protein [Gemmatimonadota bacterium]